MSLFKIYRQNESLPTVISPGTMYFEQATKLLYVDTLEGRVCLTNFPDDLADLNDDPTHRLVTDEEKTQWNAAQPNQNAFSVVNVNGTSLTSKVESDILVIKPGNNITLSPDTSDNSFIITAQDTLYTLTQDPNNGHFIILTPSVGQPTRIEIPDNNTEYTLTTNGNSVVLTSSDDETNRITVPFATVAGEAQSMDAANLYGMIDIERIPPAALERMVIVPDDEARFALTIDDVQLGDSVKVASTQFLYLVKDVNNLDNEAGYEEYFAGNAASVPWTGVTGKPDTFPPSEHIHDLVTTAEDGFMSAQDKGFLDSMWEAIQLICEFGNIAVTQGAIVFESDDQARLVNSRLISVDTVDDKDAAVLSQAQSLIDNSLIEAQEYTDQQLNTAISGQVGSLAVFNSENTIVNGPGFSDDTTKYLRSDGQWGSPQGNGTVTEIDAGVGLTTDDGDPITTSGTIKANLLSETPLENGSSAGVEQAGRIFPVAVDVDGYLAVSVPDLFEGLTDHDIDDCFVDS